MKWEDNMKDFDKLVEEIAQSLPNPAEGFVSKEQEKAIGKALSEIEGFKEFLKATLSADMRRHFAASPIEQERIKGAFSRTVYLLGLARAGGEETMVENSLNGKRKSIGELQNL